MEYWFKDVQQEYGYSDYEIAKIKYVLACLISEFSKISLLFFGEPTYPFIDEE